MSKKKSNGPLLYIHQPFARTPATSMQDTYTSRQEEMILEEEIPREEESSKKISLAKKEIIQDKATKEVTKLEEPSTTVQTKSPASPTPTQDKKTTSSFNRVKPFKEMNIKERLDYLNNYPRVLPPARCVFVTEEENYQGYLVEYDEQEATIRFQDQSTKTLPANALKNIIMIGIKK